MIDIEQDLKKEELNLIFKKYTKILNFKNIKEEIDNVYGKMGRETKAASFPVTKEEKYQFLLFYIQNLFKYLLNFKKIDDKKIYVSITITNPTNIQKINKEYRNLDKTTDVLSFPAIEKEDIESFIKKLNQNKKQNENQNQNDNQYPNENIKYFGDIVISLEKTILQAEEYGHSFVRELSYLLIHSFLHLLGYDHIIKEDEDIMRKKEEEILNILDIKR